ncbi:unnamed protein product [Boreogadus saida]
MGTTTLNVTSYTTLVNLFFLSLSLESHGQRFAYWTNEATALLQGSLQPIYRIPKSRKRNHEVSMMLVAEDTQCHAPFCNDPGGSLKTPPICAGCLFCHLPFLVCRSQVCAMTLLIGECRKDLPCQHPGLSPLLRWL